MLKNLNFTKLLCILFLLVATVVGATVYSVVDYNRYVGKQVFLILDDFSGGLNSKFPADTIKDEESPDLLNVRLTGFGGVEKRPSYSKYNSTAVSEEIDSTYRYYEQDATKNTFIQFDTGLYLGNDAAGTFTSKSTAITDGSRLDYVTSHNVVYMTNETDTPLCYVGGTTDAVFEWGCQVPVVTSTTLAQGTDGNLDLLATYKYKITYLYYGFEDSNGSASIDTTLINSNNKITLTAIPTGDARVTARKIYRTEGGGAVYYLLTTISDNSTTSYIDTFVDTSLNTAKICPTDNGLPPLGCQFTFLAANRVFLVDIDESKYYYSGLDTPDIFPSTNYDYVFKDDGEFLKGYAYWKGIIYWFKNTYITATVPQGSPRQWSTAKTVGRIAYPGTVSGWSIQPSPSGIYYLAPDNIYLFNGSYSQPIKEGIEGTIKDINSTYYSKLDSIYWNNTYRLTYVSTLGAGTTPNKQIIWDEFRKAYVLDDKDITCYQVWNGQGDDNELYAGTNAGYLINEEGSAESKNPFIHNTATQLNTGTKTYVKTTGIDANPVLVLDTDTLPTETLAGNLTSAVQSIDAFGIGRTYFNKQVSGESKAQIYLRTGNVVTPDATWTAWMEITNSGDYPSNTSDKDYLQYKAVLTGEYTNFIALSQTTRVWRGMTTLGSDVYACVSNGDIYKQTAGTGDFITLNQTLRVWRGMTTLGSDVYASVSGGDIYKQTAGTGDFVALSQTTRFWCGMTTLGTNVYACVYNGDIYKQSKITSNTSLITSGGYFIKVELGSRTSGESTIDFKYKTKEFDLRANGLAPHLKTYTEYIIEYDSQDTGTLYMDYFIDRVLQPRVSINLETYPKRYHGMFETGAEADIGRKIQFLFTESSINEFQLNRASVIFEPDALVSE